MRCRKILFQIARSLLKIVFHCECPRFNRIGGTSSNEKEKSITENLRSALKSEKRKLISLTYLIISGEKNVVIRKL